MDALLRLQPGRPLVVAGLAFLLAVGVNALAWTGDSGWWIVPLYHFTFAIGVCIVLPTWYHAVACGRPLHEIGLTLARWRRDVAVGVAFIVFTLTPRLGEIDTLPAAPALVWLAAAMCLSTLFEEVFFRGFLQTTVQRALGIVPALVLSSLAFSLYHVGYGPEWREPARLIQLFFVGLMFGVAFQTTGSVVTSFTLNLPHAIVTFMLEDEYFDAGTAAVSVVAVLTGLGWLAYVSRTR